MTTRRSVRSGLTLAALCAVAGCSFVQQWLPQRSEPAPAAEAPRPPPAPVVDASGLAPITEAQTAQIRAALAARKTGPAAARALQSAHPTIESFVQVHSCITAHNGAVLDPWAAPGRRFDGVAYRNAPVPRLQFHDKTACATVKRFANWAMPSRRVLRFEIVYVGDDGEESVKTAHEMVQQPGGGWLFTR